MLGPADASDDIGRRGIGMSIKECVWISTASIGDARIVFYVSFLVFIFTLNDGLQADGERFWIMRRKRLSDRASTLQ